MKKIALILVLIAVIAGGAAFFLAQEDEKQVSNQTSQAPAATNQQQTSTPSTSQQPTTQSTGNDTTATSYTAADVAKRASQNDCWTIIEGSVYDITSYVPRHPGGVREIVQICGRDGTSLFNGNPNHDSSAKSQLARLKIGTLSQ